MERINANEIEIDQIVTDAQRARLRELERERMGWQDAKARAEHRKMELEKQEHQKRVCMGRAMIPVLAAATMIGCMIVGLVAPVVALPWATVNCCCAAVRLDRFTRLSRKEAAA